LSCSVLYCNDYNNLIKKNLFNVVDYFIEVKQVNDTFGKKKKVSNLYQMYWATPYKNTIYLDCDFLINKNIANWFKVFDFYDIFFIEQPLNFRNELYNINTQCNFFKDYKLPVLQSQIFGFSKNETSLEFFNVLSQISNNYNVFYNSFLKTNFQDEDICVSLSLANKICNLENNILRNYINYIELKPLKINYTDSKQTNFYNNINLWVLPGLKFKIQNYVCTNPIHYNFIELLTEDLTEDLEKYL